ncbi:MAG: site-specific integrase, partial [Lactobacillus crispatus]|nr:site-specific integrase [Lactobacillus crispatus]MCT7714221.1 site-specific integrase [Lactobacillus crispatus]
GINPETGKVINVTRSKLKSRKEAEELRRNLKAQGPSALSQKIETAQKKITVSYVYNVWLEVMKQDVRGSTLGRLKDTWKN